MTEVTWLTGSAIVPMLDWIRGGVSDRKLRLFACGCVRSEWHSLIDSRSKRVVELAEEFADGYVTADELERARLDSLEVLNVKLLSLNNEDQWTQMMAAMSACKVGETHLYPMEDSAAWRIARTVVYGVPTAPTILRDIVGNPFRPVFFESRWRTSTAVAIARSIVVERQFERLPSLGNALAQAGCEDETILSHCTQQGPHFRGCWILDLVNGLSE